MNKTLLKKVAAIATTTTLAIAPLAINLPTTYAASLSDVSVVLDAETTATATGVAINFSVQTAITAGSKFEVSYDTNFTGGAALLDGDIATSASGGNLGVCTETDMAAGYFLVTCTGTALAAETVTIDIDGANDLTTPATSGNYNFSVVADIGGAGTTIDYGAGLAYVADDNDVTVTAVVPPVIDMELYQTGTDTELVDANSCNLGVLSLTQVKDCTYDIGFATNNTSGLTVQVVRDGVMDDGSGNDINAIADGSVTAGAEEYGFQITDAGAGCSATAQGNYGTQDEPVPAAATDFIVSTDVCNGTTALQSAKRTEVTHRASMDTDTVVGTYDQVVTYTAYTN